MTEPVAWRWRLHSDGRAGDWYYGVDKPLGTSACWEVQPLYAAPQGADTREAWRCIATAPKDGTPFLAWCPIVIGLGDTDATPDAEMRIIWWEARGQFTSDRDLGNEDFTHWMPLPAHPRSSTGSDRTEEEGNELADNGRNTGGKSYR